MTQPEIKSWLIVKIAEESDLKPESIATNVSFESFNLDSLSLITLAFDLETLLGKEIDPTLFWQHNSIDQLAEALQPIA